MTKTMCNKTKQNNQFNEKHTILIINTPHIYRLS